MSGHTPGPWVADYTMGVWSVGAGQPWVEIAPTVTEEDARLIAAAPDLLEALKMCVTERSEWLDEARAAISKAIGAQ